MADGVLFSQEAYEQYKQLLRKVNTMRGGPGILVLNTPTGIVISLGPQATPKKTSERVSWKPTSADIGWSFKVIVKANGTSGGLPTYDLYALDDTGYVAKLNLAGALVPKCSRARFQTAVTAVAPADGSIGDAYYDTSGAIQLFDLPETLCTA